MPSRLQLLTASFVGLWALLANAGPAAAHTGFESSNPADGATVSEPVSEITLTFSGEATPAGDGFVILDPSGTVRPPDQVSSDDNLTWTLRFAEPLAGGEVGVRWMVAAPDAHPIDGSFSFTVTAAPSAAADDEVTAADTLAATSADGGTSSGQAGASAGDASAVDLESFLDTTHAEPAAAGTIAATARVLSIVGAVLVLGGAAFAAFGLRGEPSDVRQVLYWVRRGGVLVVLSAVGQAMTTVATLGGDWSSLVSPGDVADALWSSTGLAIGLRAAGGFLAASETGLETTMASTTADPVLAARQLASVGANHTGTAPSHRAPEEPFVYATDHMWDHRFALGGLVGVALVALSFAFDGHTASEGPRALHAVANVVHVTTASIWAGGVAMLALTLHRRRIRKRPTQALQLAMRFSVVATIALVAAGLAGVVLSVVILDSVSEIWSTPWGRLLALKVVVVAAAAAGGAYNHRVVVPALDREREDQPTVDRFRTVVTFEATALFAVAVTTAFLIAASSS